MFAGSCDPLQVVLLVAKGIDVFDTSYAAFCSEDGRAICVRTVEGEWIVEGTRAEKDG